MTDTDQRPDPDQLLAKVREQDALAGRGKLRIYFGASAGVGKTYAMLQAGRDLASKGREILVGVVETHGRRETQGLLDGLEILPPKEIDYRGRTLKEFDLDAALARKPSLILVDELAHTNVSGSRHPKRWHDVEELLAAGIDVFSTLNVQHLESLNDVVGGITQIRVWETVPDTVFDEADEVVLVDITTDELLARLKAGKVYIAEQAERAAGNFFRKGNLMALREIALRRTADRVEDDVQAYRLDRAIQPVWKTEAALLVCIGPDAAASGWCAAPLAWRISSALNGTRFTSRRRNCSGCRAPSASAYWRRSNWPRGSARTLPCSPATMSRNASLSSRANTIFPRSSSAAAIAGHGRGGRAARCKFPWRRRTST